MRRDSAHARWAAVYAAIAVALSALTAGAPIKWDW